MSKEIPELNPVPTIKRGPYTVSIAEEAYSSHLRDELEHRAREVYHVPDWVTPKSYTDTRTRTFVMLFEWHEIAPEALGNIFE